MVINRFFPAPNDFVVRPSIEPKHIINIQKHTATTATTTTTTTKTSVHNNNIKQKQVTRTKKQCNNNKLQITNVEK